jgi:hypothetical protein
MLIAKYVIDKNGYFIENVVYDDKLETIQGYELKNGESLVPAANLGLFARAKWNGKEWIEGAAAVEVEKKYTERLNLFMDSKLDEVNLTCKQTIENGFDLKLINGEVKHFSLSEADQINISAAHSAILQGATGYSYHADGELCTWFSAEDITLLALTASQFKTYQTTYCNHLRHWIKRETDLEVLKNIQYGAELPRDLQKSIKKLLHNL